MHDQPGHSWGEEHFKPALIVQTRVAFEAAIARERAKFDDEVRQVSEQAATEACARVVRARRGAAPVPLTTATTTARRRDSAATSCRT